MDEIYYSKKILCPVCENSFYSTKIKSRMLKLKKSDTDMCKYYEGANPYYYEINVCPRCGFAFSDNFNKKLDINTIKKFINEVTAHWKKQDLCGRRNFDQAVESFKLAILSGQTVGLGEANMAGLCMRLCWLYRESGNTEEEMRFMKVAVQFYKKAFETGNKKSEESMRPEILVYLLGELSFRTGDYKEAAQWFNLAISRYNSDPSVKKQTLVMIRERWMEIKEEIKNNA